MGPPGSADLKQRMATVPSPQQVIDLKAKSNSMQGNQTSPGITNSSSPQVENNNFSKSFVFQMHDQHAHQMNQYQAAATYHPKKPPDNQEVTSYPNQTLYYCCRVCGNYQSTCKCSTMKNEINGRNELGADTTYFHSEQNKNTGGLIERYLRGQANPQQNNNHQRTPPSCSSSSSSVSSMVDGNSNMMMMHDQTTGYGDQGEFSNQQHTVHHRHDQQHLYQQVPNNADQQQLMISADGEALMHQLTYNYDEQEPQHQHQQQQQVCADGWHDNLSLVGSQRSENCSSHSNHLHHNNNSNYHQQESLSKDRSPSFRLANNESHQHQVIQPQQEQRMGRTYSNTAGLHKMVSPNNATIDFNNNSSNNNNQQHLVQQSASYSSTSLVSTSDGQHNHSMQNSYSCRVPDLSQDNEHEQPQHYSGTSNTSNYYPPADTSHCNESNNTFNQHADNRHLYQNHNQDSYLDQTNRFEMNKHIQHQRSPTDNQQQQQHQTTSLHFTTYDQLQHIDPQVQPYQSDDRLQLKQMVGQYHNEQHQLYYTGISHMPIDSSQQDQQVQQNEYKMPSVGGAQTHLSQYDQNDNHYPSTGDLQKSQDNYASLQQLTLDCDNHTNQVTTTTLTTERSTQGGNKSRSSKGRRGRPRKKGLRSKNKVNGKLWEFIRDLLLSDRTNPSFIRWERREDGVFKFVQSDKVAKMWGERKQNPKMTYEKLSRAMRYYYKSKVLLPVFGRRLVYKFGPNATGWMADDTNMSNNPF